MKKINNKGSLQDLIFAMIVIFGFSLIVLFAVRIYTEIDDNVQDGKIFEAEQKAQSAQVKSAMISSIDNTYLLLLVFFIMGTLILAALVRVHPIFIPIYFFGWIFVVFLSTIFANVYYGVSSNPEMAETASQFFFMDNMMVMLPFLIGLFGMILMVVIYKLWSVD